MPATPVMAIKVPELIDKTFTLKTQNALRGKSTMGMVVFKKDEGEK